MLIQSFLASKKQKRLQNDGLPPQPRGRRRMKGNRNGTKASSLLSMIAQTVRERAVESLLVKKEKAIDRTASFRISGGLAVVNSLK